jgi:hypothetical protein
MKCARFLVVGSTVLIAGCSSGGGNQATPPAPGRTTTTFTGAGAPVPPRHPPMSFAGLGQCPPRVPAEPLSSVNAGVPGLGDKLVPITASKALVCRYAGAGRLRGGRTVADSALAHFEAEMNGLRTTTSVDATCDQPPGAPFFVVIFGNRTQQVFVNVTTCAGATNGVLFARTTATSAGELLRFTANSLPAQKA